MTVDDFLRWLGETEPTLPMNTLRDMEITFKVVNRDAFRVFGADVNGNTIELH